MKLNTALLFLLASLCSPIDRVTAEIVRIPQDEASIQDACDNAESGDTLRISAGIYDESLLIANKYFTIEGDTTHPENFIINPASGGSALMIRGELEGQMIVRGITLTGGSGSVVNASRYGGGIYCNATSSYPLTLENCIVSENTADIGGGLYMEGMHLCVYRSLIVENSAENGGALFIDRPDGDFQPGCFWTLIARNHAQNAIVLLNGVSQSFVFRNCTLTANESEDWLLSINDSQIDLQGTILWDNNSLRIYDNDQRTMLLFRYCLIQGGRQAISGDIDQWTGDMLTVAPEFTDPENHDYTLSPTSPCIDHGYPYPTLDPDGSRSDMGAYSYYHNRGIIISLRDRTNNEPIPGVQIALKTPRKFTEERTSDENGDARLFGFPDNGHAGVFTISLNHPEYIDRVFNFQFSDNDTAILSYYLSRSAFELTPSQLTVNLLQGERTDVSFEIRNNSDIGLNWYVKNDQSYSILSEFNIEEYGRVEAATFDGENFLLADCYADGDRSVFLLDRDGQLTGQYRQPYQAGTGFRSMDWANDSLWAAGDRTVYRLTRDGRWIRSFPIAITATGIAWDYDAEVLRIVGLYSSIISYDAAGNRLDAVISRKVQAHYGISWYQNDPQGYQLYMLTSGDNDANKVLVKLNTDTGDTLMVGKVDDRMQHSIGVGLNSTTLFDDHGKPTWLLFSVDSTQVPPVHQFSAVKFNSSDEWLSPSNVKGFLAPNNRMVIHAEVSTILGETDTLETGDYETELTVLFDLPTETVTIPVNLHIAPNDVGSSPDNLSPVIFTLSPPFPNPFNARVNFEFDLAREEAVEISIHDLNGRVVQHIAGRNFPAGSHLIKWDAANCPSGLYLLSVKAGDSIENRKLMLMR